MRVNIYSQELTNEIVKVKEISNTGRSYHAVRFMLHSSDKLHHQEDDDDRSGVTFWLPASKHRKKEFITTLRRAAAMVEKSLTKAR